MLKDHLCYILVMPANLPPEYFEAEKRFKEAANPQEKAVALEELIATVPKHKGTDKLRAELRRRLSQLREEAAKRKKSGKGDLYTIEKQGAAQVALAGFANSGKSSILKTLTNANPVVADYPVSTVSPLSGMMPFEDIQLQLVDLPPIGNESTDGWVSGSLRIADALLLVVDLSEDPDIQAELLIGQLGKWRIGLLKRSEPSAECPGCKPVVVAANKSDIPAAKEGLNRLRSKYEALFPVVPVSTAAKEGLEELRSALFENSRIIRVYSKEPGKEPDRATPFVLPLGSTVLDLAEMIHRDFLHNLKYACIWGSVKFGGQRVQKDYALHDRDVVEYHLK
jgi:ribosome-interacting GTPase 1